MTLNKLQERSDPLHASQPNINTTKTLQQYTELSQTLLQEVKTYLETQNINLNAFFDIALSDTYKYPDPYQKAKTITHTTIRPEQREVRNSDRENIDEWIWGECRSNTYHLFDKCHAFLENIPNIRTKIAYWSDNNFFASENSVHIFLTIEAQGRTIIVDPSLKFIAFLEESGYTIRGYLDKVTNPAAIEPYTKYITPLCFIHFDPQGQQYTVESPALLPLGTLGQGSVFVSYVVGILENTYHVPLVRVQDILWNGYYSFLDKNGQSIHSSDYGFLPWLNTEIVKILRHFENVLRTSRKFNTPKS